MKKTLLLLIILSLSVSITAEEKVTGLWKSISDETQKISSISVIYEYNGKIYGRILVAYDENGNLVDSIANPTEKAVNIKGEPFFSGLDFIWNMEKKGNKWTKGKIMDPNPAKIYSCDIWRENENLVVRGKIGPFGRNQVWLPVTRNDKLPEGLVIPENLVPVIPEPKA